MADAAARISPGGDTEFSVEYSATDTVKTVTIDKLFVDNEDLPKVNRGFLVIPNWTNVVTLDAAFTISSNDQTITLDNQFTALARNATREMADLTVPVARQVTLTLTLSGAPGGSGGTVYGYLLSASS